MIKSADVDKGGGDKTLIHKMWIKNMFVFFNPSLRGKGSNDYPQNVNKIHVFLKTSLRP